MIERDDNKHNQMPLSMIAYYQTMSPAAINRLKRAIEQFENDLTALYGCQQAHKDLLTTLWIAESDYSYIMEQGSK